MLVAAGCSSKAKSTGSQRPSTTAQIQIVQPTAGEVVTGTTLQVMISLTGGTIVPTATASPLPGNVGHIHLIDNGSIVSMAFGTTQQISVTPGTHFLEAEFVASDHGSYYPRDISSVHFTAQ